MPVRSRNLSAFYELIYNPSYTPSRSSDAHIQELEIDGQPTFVLSKQSTGEYYEVDRTTNAIWELLDGRRTINGIWEEAVKAEDSLTEKDVREVIMSLAEEGAIETTEAELEQKRVELVSAFQVDVRLVKDCSKSLAGLFRITRKLMRGPEIYIAAAISILGVVLFAGTFVRIFSNFGIFEIGGSTLVGLLFYGILVLSPAIAVHELTHAAVCDYYGGKPGSFGTGLYFLSPFFYVDTSDSWRLSRRARIMISLSGPLVDVVIGSVLTFWSYFVQPGFGKNLLEISAFFCFYGALANFSPIIETDGYYILSEALNRPNLRDESFAYLKRAITSKLRGARAGRSSSRQRRVFLGFAVAAIAWFALFGYTTFDFLSVYGSDAYRAFTVLSQMIIRTRPPDAGSIVINIVALAYFALFLAGFGVMGVVYYRKARRKGIKLETIHDKRVSAFVPIPSFVKREDAAELLESAKSAARKLSRSNSVTLEPPFCVVALKLGRVDQSLDEMRGDMREVEIEFRKIHHSFLSKKLADVRNSNTRDFMAHNLETLADQFPAYGRKAARASAKRFCRRHDEMIRLLFESAFGTIWTLELPPDDYKRIRRELFPGLVAEDLGMADLPGELEDFKRRVVIGTDTIAQLSSEVEEETKELKKNPEVYQLTAFLEPMKSRLIFLGRTDKVEGSIVWLGGLFLYQAWTSYIRNTLSEASLGLRSIRLTKLLTIARAQAAKLSDTELELLNLDLERMENLSKTVEESIARIESTYASANNFHEALASLVSDETFDIGLYRPILNTNSKHLEGVKSEIDSFRSEFTKIHQALGFSATGVQAEFASRSSAPRATRETSSSAIDSLLSRFTERSRRYSPVFEREVELMMAYCRYVYGVAIGGEDVL